MRPEGWITWKTLQYISLWVVTIPPSQSIKCFECGKPNTVSNINTYSFVLKIEDHSKSGNNSDKL